MLSTSAGGSFSYNANGYMKSRQDASGAAVYTYLWWGNHKLRRITSNATDDRVWFYYGPNDERVRQLRQTPNVSGRNYNTWSAFPWYQLEYECQAKSDSPWGQSDHRKMSRLIV